MAEGGLFAEQIRQLRASYKELRDDTDYHDQTLFRGNGKPGVCTRLQQAEDRLDVIEQSIKDFKDTQKWAIRLLVGILIAAVANLVLPHR